MVENISGMKLERDAKEGSQILYRRPELDEALFEDVAVEQQTNPQEDNQSLNDLLS